MSDERHVYPGTTVLRNALGTRDADELHRVEANLNRLRIARLAGNPFAGEYCIAHLLTIHGQLVGLAAMRGDEQPLRELLSDVVRAGHE